MTSLLLLLCVLSSHILLVLSLTCFPDNGYTLQASATNSLPESPESLRLLRECSNQCMVDSCCLSYGLKDGQCETAPFKSHDLDYVKEVSVKIDYNVGYNKFLASC